MADATLDACELPGSNMTIYYDTANDCDTPVWVEHVGIDGDLTINDEDDQNRVARRGTAHGIKEYSSGDTELEIEGQQVPDFSYEGFQRIIYARKGGPAQHFLILSDKITVVGAFGYRGKWKNFRRNHSGPNEGQQEYSFLLKPAACSDCNVRPVQIAVASTPADYDPTTII